jgi:hypothetical protein
MKIKKATGFQTEDGRIFATLNEAAGYTYSNRIKEALGTRNTGVFGVSTVLTYSRELEIILHEYNEAIDSFERDNKP